MSPHPATDLLQTPVTLGALRLPNRIIMSPLTRLRTDEELAPTKLVAEYYAQRASAGLIISEAVAVAPSGDGYPAIPGLFTARQAEAWRTVVEAVHAQGGRIAAQFSHNGRARYATDDVQRAAGWWAVANPLKPHELTPTELSAMVESFGQAARTARAIGFDAVEIHNGNGYLLDQFLRAGANQRTDAHGGSLENRTRLALELVTAVSEAMGADRVGIRLSPSATVDGAPDPSGEETFAYLLERLAPLGLAYVHATRTTEQDRRHGSGPGIPLERVRALYPGKLIGAGDFTREDGERAVAEGTVDAVAYGRLFIANPDLPERFARRTALNVPDHATFYTPGPAGFTDYPRLS
ncbi:alkene reductase [Cystobacter fuscus]